MKNFKNKSIISILLIIILALANIAHAQDEIQKTENSHDTSLYMSLKQALDIIDDFDYYSLATPEELRQTANAFKEISDSLVDHISEEDTNRLRELNIKVYESLNGSNINMGGVHDLFEEITEFAKSVDGGEDVIYIKRSKVIEEIEKAYGTDQNLIVGYADNKDREDSYITKAEVGTILYRIAEQNKKNSKINEKVEIPGLEKHWSEKFLCNQYISTVLHLEEDSNVDEYITKSELKQLVEYFN